MLGIAVAVGHVQRIARLAIGAGDLGHVGNARVEGAFHTGQALIDRIGNLVRKAAQIRRFPVVGEGELRFRNFSDRRRPLENVVEAKRDGVIAVPDRIYATNDEI